MRTSWRSSGRKMAVALICCIVSISPAAIAQIPASVTSPAASQPLAPGGASASGVAAPAVPVEPVSSSVVAPTSAVVSLPRDLSPWGMFIHADVVVKSIMIGLVLASIVTWTIWLAKLFELAGAKRRVRRALQVLSSSPTLEKAVASFPDHSDATARLVNTAHQEALASPDASPDALKERVAWLLARVEAGAGRRIGRGMGVLASVGAISPFVGLFGTVWGIMNSFIGISQANTTNLAVVAPGIAEALLATALGLFAAIPAVVMYNSFARAIGGYRAQLSDASTLVMRLVSRDCDAEARHYRMARAAE